MSAQTLRLDYATSLLEDLRAASHSALPRREALTGWLQEYVKHPRSAEREPDVALTTENLLAINAHLVAFGIPATRRWALA